MTLNISYPFSSESIVTFQMLQNDLDIGNLKPYLLVHFYRDGLTKIMLGDGYKWSRHKSVYIQALPNCSIIVQTESLKLGFQGSFTNFNVMRLMTRKFINEFIWSVANFIKNSLICATL